jgi:hypothetical protein
MANTNVTSISGGATAGGLLNISDADLIALVLGLERPVTDTSLLFASSGAIPTADETWGVLIG